MKRARSIGLLLVYGALLCGALWFLFRNVNLGAALHALGQANPALLVAAASVNVVTILVQGQRLHALTHALTRVSRITTAEAVSLGFAGSSILPARGGEVVKLTIINRATNLNSSTIVALITLENILNAVGLLLIAAAVLFVGGAPDWVRRLALGGLGALPLVLFAIYRLKPVEVDPEARPWRARLQNFRNSLHAGFSPVRRPKVLGTSLLLTVAAWSLELVTSWLTLEAFRLSPSLLLTLMLLLGVNAAILIPATPGQMGVYEVAAMVVLHQAGINGSTAFIAALSYHMVHMVPTFLTAGFFLFRRQLRGATGV